MKNKKILALLITFSAVLSSVNPIIAEEVSDLQEKTIIETEGFSSGKKSWSHENNDAFYISDEELKVKNIDEDSEAITISDKFMIDKGELEFDFDIKNGEYLSIFLKYVDNETHYALRLYPNGNRALLIKKVNGGSYMRIAEGRYESNNGRIHISFIGNDIKVFINDQSVLSVTDKSIDSGKIGFVAYKTEAVIDNIEYYKFSNVLYESNTDGIDSTKETEKIYVSVDGSDTNGDGSKEKPYATIYKAKDAAKKAKRKKIPIDVIFSEGTYSIDKSVEFTKLDSGTKNAPIRYIAEDGEKVVFSGGRKIDVTKAEPVSEEIKKRLYSNISDKVIAIDLREQGIDTKKFDFRPSATEQVGQILKPTQVSLNGVQQQLSRWPNSGYIDITDCDAGGSRRDNDGFEKTGAIYYNVNVPSRWTNAKDIFVDGSLAHLWNREWAEVESVDVTKNAINFKYATAYGIKNGGRWAAVNLLEEIDIPGEWYIDFDEGIFYYYPPYKLSEADELVISELSQTMLMVGADYLEFEGLELSMVAGDTKVVGDSSTGGNAIFINDGVSNVAIKDCIIKNIGFNGIYSLGNNITIDGCIITDIGLNGIRIRKSGDRQTVTSGNVVIKNNDISNISRDGNIAGTVGVLIEQDSVGVSVINNVIHNCPNAGILYQGFNNRIAYNEIYNCVTRAADAGAIYAGRSWVSYGNVIEYNLFHDIGQKNNSSSYPASSIFWDDLQSGSEFSHNISVPNNYVKTSSVKIGGGIDNIVKGNTMVASEKGIIGEDRTTSGAKAGTLVWKSQATTNRYTDADKNNPVYKKVFPQMTSILDRIEANDGILKIENIISDNLLVDCPKGDTIAQQMINDSEVGNNVSIENDYSIFVNPEKLDYRVKKEAKLKYGISDEILDEDFDLEKIGIQDKNDPEQKYKEFMALYPEEGSQNVSSDRAVLAWSKSLLADNYTYVLATDVEMKNTILEQNTIENSVVLEGLEKGKTYYWKVIAHNLSRQFGFDAETKVYSFTIDNNEEINKLALSESIDAAVKLASTFVEGNKPGQYKIGSVKNLREIVKNGTITNNNPRATQKEVDDVTYTINMAMKNIDGFINPGYTTLNITPSSDWICNNKNVQINSQEGNVAISSKGGTQVTLNERLSNYNVMCFKTKIDDYDNNAWFAYTLRLLDPQSVVYTQDCYYFLVKEDSFELQNHGVVYQTATNNGKLSPGEWHDVEFGAITTENGINLFLKIDGEVIFDYLDKTNPQYRPGMFSLYISSNESDIEIAKSENVSDGIYQFSDKILKEIETKAYLGQTLYANNENYSENGIWSDKSEYWSGIYGLRTTKDAGATAEWLMVGDDTANGKVYNVSYYHLPQPDGDKNVTVHIYGYGGEYTTTIDMSSGEQGFVSLGNFKFVDADYIGKLAISFTGSGSGVMNVNCVKFELADGEVDMLAQ